jgi:hypothetical protein
LLFNSTRQILMGLPCARGCAPTVMKEKMVK